MKKIIIFLRGDKTIHFLICYFIVSVLIAINLAVLGVAIALSAAIGKEINDLRKGGVFSLGDFIADLLGVFIALLLFL